MGLKTKLALAAAIALTACGQPAESSLDDHRAYYFSVRSFVLTERARDWPGGGVLFIGDSITEMSAPVTLCGLPVFNAGISGSRVEDWENLAPSLVRMVHPELVVIALGVNDAQRTLPFDASAWEERYSRLAALAPNTLLIIPSPVEPGKRYGPQYYDPDRLDWMATTIGRLGRAIRPGPLTTIDGVHLDGAGRVRWVAAAEHGC